MSGLGLNFVVFAGDPDEGAAPIAAQDVLKDLAAYKEHLSFASENIYGAVVIERDGERLADLKAEPIVSLVTKFVRALPFVLDGEPESAVLTESEHGFLFEPASMDDIYVSFFAGDAYEPDEFIVERETVKTLDFGDQVLAMASNLISIMKQADPEGFDNHEYSEGLREMFDMASDKLKNAKLEKEKGFGR